MLAKLVSADVADAVDDEPDFTSVSLDDDHEIAEAGSNSADVAGIGNNDISMLIVVDSETDDNGRCDCVVVDDGVKKEAG